MSRQSVLPREQFDYARIATNASTAVKVGQGALHTISVNKVGAAANVCTVYDGLSAAGTVIAAVDTTARASILYDVVFNIGLFIVTATGTAGDITVSYR